MPRMFRSSGLPLAGLALAAALLGASCKADVSTGNPTVAKATVEKQTQDGLEKAAGQRPDAITCPGDLEAKIGVTMRCELSAGGEKIGLTITVDSAEGTNVHWKTEVDAATAPAS